MHNLTATFFNSYNFKCQNTLEPIFEESSFKKFSTLGRDTQAPTLKFPDYQVSRINLSVFFWRVGGRGRSHRESDPLPQLFLIQFSHCWKHEVCLANGNKGLTDDSFRQELCRQDGGHTELEDWFVDVTSLWGEWLAARWVVWQCRWQDCSSGARHVM
jgi:hypothetical protein